MKLIYTSFSPNTRLKDLWLNFKLLLGHCFTSSQGGGVKVAAIFDNRFGNNSKTYTFNYARSGMFVLFKSLNLPENAEVLVQGFTCSAAVNPIKWAGLNPVYVDTDPNTLNMDFADLKKKISSKTSAVMFQHTFGNSGGINEVAEICKEKNILLIEDCTHTIFGEYPDGKTIGSKGSAAIFSFGRDKAVSGVSGGAIVINNPLLLASFEKLYSTVPYPTRGWVGLELLQPLLWATIKFFFNIKIGKAVHLIAKKLGLLTYATSAKEKVGEKPLSVPMRLPAPLESLALAQLEDIDTFNAHRKKIADIYIKELSSVAEVKTVLFEKGNVPLRFPILVESRKELVSYLEKNNVYVGDWYTAPVVPLNVPMSQYGYVLGNCKVSEDLCTKIVNLPTHINTSVSDAQNVAKLIKDFYTK